MDYVHLVHDGANALLIILKPKDSSPVELNQIVVSPSRGAISSSRLAGEMDEGGGAVVSKPHAFTSFSSVVVL